jgi:hypothetical protein
VRRGFERGFFYRLVIRDRSNDNLEINLKKRLIVVFYTVSLPLAYLLWSWLLTFLQDGVMHIMGWKLIDHSDEWHPAFMILLILLLMLTVYLIGTRIKAIR